jgi:(2Fe-2S) ferredoxin
MEKLTRELLKKNSRESTGRAAGSYVKVGMSSCGIAAGAQKIFDLLKEEIGRAHPEVAVERCGCNGLCYAEPLVEVSIEGVPPVLYGQVTPDIAHRIVEEHLGDRRLLNDHIYAMAVKGTSAP